MSKQVLKILSQFSIVVFVLVLVAVMLGNVVQLSGETPTIPQSFSDIEVSYSQTSTMAAEIGENKSAENTGNVEVLPIADSEPLSTSVPSLSTSKPSAQAVQIPTTQPQLSLIEQVSTHNSISDCWVAFQGHVYDISSYFGSHPGGDTTLAQYCGKDMSSGFTTKGNGPGQDHSASAYSLLATYQID